MAFSKAFLQMIGEYQKPIKKEIDRLETIERDNTNIQRVDNQVKR